MSERLNPQVAEVGGRLRGLQSSLQHNVMREFELLGMGDEAPNMLLLDRLRSCCMVVDALGAKVPAVAAVNCTGCNRRAVVLPAKPLLTHFLQ